EHPAREERRADVVAVRSGAPLAPHVAARGQVPVGGIDDLAHRDPHQELPELLAAGWRGLALPLAGAEADVHALEDVLLILAAANAVIQVPADQGLQPGCEPLPDDPGRLIALASIG